MLTVHDSMKMNIAHTKRNVHFAIFGRFYQISFAPPVRFWTFAGGFDRANHEL